MMRIGRRLAVISLGLAVLGWGRSQTVAAGPARELILAEGGKTDYRIVTPAHASKPAAHAARELASFLKQITGAQFAVVNETAWRGEPAIFVGLSAAARRVTPQARIGGLGHEGFVILTSGEHLLLIGGAPRGTLYAVYTFLEDYLGCRWWTSTASYIPQKASLRLGHISDRQVPVLEYREPFFWDAFDGDWAVRNRANGMQARLDDARGGQITYQGFVHTAFQLVPPENHFDSHPEWFAMTDGKRERERVRQLCMTNEELRRFVAQRVIEWLRANPKANIVSVSQTDDPGYCQCPTCQALNEKEGSPAGSLVHFVNAVAREVRKEFPRVAIDTLAYQRTRKPPRYVRPDANVIVRLCSIECDFARPMTDQANRDFYQDLVGWGRICKRLYMWDYVTNFNHFFRPQPVVHVLGPNVRTFVENGVRGIFEQGSYLSPGGDMAELKAWLLAKMLWDPKRPPQALIDEFLHGYYGAAAPHVRTYLEAMHRDALEHNYWVGCGAEVNAPFPSYQAMVQSEEAFRQAMKAVAGDPELERRVRLAHMPVTYSWLWRPDLRLQADAAGFKWCASNDFLDGAHDVLAICKENAVTQYAEGRPIEQLEQSLVGFGRTRPVPPAGFAGVKGLIDMQELLLQRRGAPATMAADPAASDGVCVVRPGTEGSNCETQAKLWFGQNPGWTNATYKCFVVVKCELTGTKGTAFGLGIYSPDSDEDIVSKDIPAAQVANGEWQTYEVGTVALKRFKQAPVLWVGMAGNPENVRSVAVDRFFLVPAQ